MTTLIQSAFAAGSPLAFATPNVVPNTLGNLLAVVVYMEATIANPSITCSDLLGNAYIGMGLRMNDNATAYTELFIVPSCLAGINEVTGTVFDGAVPLSGERLLIHEFSAVPSFHHNANASGTGLAQSSGLVASGINAFLFGYEMANITSGQNSVTPGAGWTQAIVFSPAPAVITQYQDIVSAGDYDSPTTSAVNKGGACHWVSEILAFDEVATVSTSDIALAVPALVPAATGLVGVQGSVAVITPTLQMSGTAKEGINAAGAIVVPKARLTAKVNFSAEAPGAAGEPELAGSTVYITSTAYTIKHSDREKLLVFNNSAPVAVTVPRAIGAFGSGWRCSLMNEGAGTVTLTPTTSTINGSSTRAFIQNQGGELRSGGVNWDVAGDFN